MTIFIMRCSILILRALYFVKYFIIKANEIFRLFGYKDVHIVDYQVCRKIKHFLLFRAKQLP